MRRLLIAAILLAALIAVPLALASPSHQVRCGSQHACIERVARISCATRHDGWHCRIYHRWQRELKHLAHAAEVARFHTLTWAPQTSTPKPAPAQHVLAPTISSRDLCVANREAGSPGAYTYSTVDWSINTGNGFTGAYQFMDATWQEAQRYMGLATEIAPGKYSYVYGDEAWTATPAQQTAVFDYWAAKYGSGPWPNTGPPCGLVASQ